MKPRAGGLAEMDVRIRKAAEKTQLVVERLEGMCFAA
jgi:hypothetical protein